MNPPSPDSGEQGERWNIKRADHGHSIEQAVTGPDTDWIEVVPASIADDLRAELERVKVTQDAHAETLLRAEDALAEYGPGGVEDRAEAVLAALEAAEQRAQEAEKRADERLQQLRDTEQVSDARCEEKLAADASLSALRAAVEEHRDTPPNYMSGARNHDRDRILYAALDALDGAER